MNDRIAAAAGIACALWLCSCRTPGADAPATEPSPTVARVDGEAIHLDVLDAWIKDELFQQETRGGDPSRTYQLRRDYLERMVQIRSVEAAARERGVDADTLVRQEILALGPVTDAEIEAFYAEHRERMGPVSLDALAPRIREHLEQERTREAVRAIVFRADVSIELEPPRVQVAADGPALGPPDAFVTIVEFSDFQCPYCRRASPIVHALAAKYPGQVRIVYRHLPLDSIHPRARPAAEAAACADEQGLFWPYHDRLFDHPQALDDDALRAHAAALGADAARFDACFASRRYAEKVAADAAAAEEIGVTGTPAFVVNGVVLTGLQSEQALDQLIGEELERLGEARAEGDLTP